MKGITNPICKESPFNVAVFGKIDYFQATVSDSKSTAWKFFTDDSSAQMHMSRLDNAWDSPRIGE